MKRIAFLLGDPEYESHLSMPGIAETLAKQHGYDTTLCISSLIPDEPDFSISEFSHLEALADADLMVIYTRFRVLPDAQMEMIRDYLASGRPVAGLRTASHSFHFLPESKWHAWNDGFGRDVLGTPRVAHHGHSSSTDVSILPEAEGHPILDGVDPAFHLRSWVYHVLPLPENCGPLLWGVPVDPEVEPQENPVAWTRTHRDARVFMTTLGHPDDFSVPSFQAMLTNGIRWAAGEL